MEIIYGILEQGLIYGLVGIAIFLTLRVVDFPDMGVNSTFTLGAAIWFFCMKMGCNPVIATIASFFAGSFAGYCTASLNMFSNIKPLLSGIIIMMGLYSINMHIIGKPNASFTSDITIFYNLTEESKLLLLTGIIIICCIILWIFLTSEIGLAIRISGQNYKLGETYGISKNTTIGTILTLSNGINALAGALLGQSQGFIDINMGNGVLIIGLASVVIGEKFIKSDKIYLTIIMSVIGAICYKLFIAMALFSSDLGLQASDVYIVTALLIIIMMSKKTISQ